MLASTVLRFSAGLHAPCRKRASLCELFCARASQCHARTCQVCCNDDMLTARTLQRRES